MAGSCRAHGARGFRTEEKRGTVLLSGSGRLGAADPGQAGPAGDAGGHGPCKRRL